ncbi:hypothetical protein Tco_0942899 [Tanacetum coccineum]
MSNPSNNSQMHNDIMAVGSKECPYEITLVQLPYTPFDDENPRQPGEIVKETYCNTTIENCKLIDAKAKAVHMILTRIGESINIQDVKTKLFWEFGKFTSRDEESIESYYKRFYKMMNEMVRNQLVVNTMQINVHFLQQLQQEWNANPLALVVAAQHYPDTYYQAPKPHITKTSSTKSNATTRNKGEEIVKPTTSPSKSASEEDNDEEHAQRDKEI